MTLVHRTRASGLLVGAAMDHVVEAPDGGAIETEIEDDLGRVDRRRTTSRSARSCGS